MAVGSTQLMINIAASNRDALRSIRGVERSVRDMARGTSSSFNRMNRSANSFGSSMGFISKRLTALFAVRGFAKLGTKLFDLASDAEETETLFIYAMGNMEEAAREFVEKASDSLGMYDVELKKNIATLFNMSRSMGLTEQQAFKMSKSFVSLAADLTSFYNLTNNRAFEAIKSGMTGQSRPLKNLGVLTNMAALAEVARRKGIEKSVTKMSEQEKMMMRAIALHEQTSVAQGDLARTLTSSANVLRILQNIWKEAIKTWGQVLMPLLKNMFLAFMVLGRAITRVGEAFRDFLGITKAMDEANKQSKENADKLSRGEKELADSIKETGKAAKGSLASFDQMIELREQASTTGADATIDPGVMAAFEEIGNADFAEGAKGKIDALLGPLEEGLAQFIENIEPLMTDLQEQLEPFKSAVGAGLTSFYENTLVPLGEWILGKGLPGLITTLTNLLSRVNYRKINESLDGVFKSITALGKTVGNGLLWVLENVLEPVSEWAINDLAPAALDLIEASLGFLQATLRTLAPYGHWLYNSFLVPLGKWAGKLFIATIMIIVRWLGKFSDWISDNKSLIEKMTKVMGAFFLAWGLIEIMSFIQISGGVVKALGAILFATRAVTVVKLKHLAVDAAIKFMNAVALVKAMALSAKAFLSQAVAVGVANASMLRMIIIITSVVVALAFLWDKSETFRTVVVTVWKSVTWVIQSSWLVIKSVLKHMEKYFAITLPKQLLELEYGFHQFATGVKGIFKLMFNASIDMFEKGFNLMFEVINKRIRSVLKISKALGLGYENILKEIKVDVSGFKIDLIDDGAIEKAKRLKEEINGLKSAGDKFDLVNHSTLNPLKQITQLHDTMMNDITKIGLDKTDKYDAGKALTDLMQGAKSSVSSIFSNDNEKAPDVSGQFDTLVGEGSTTELGDDTISKLVVGFKRATEESEAALRNAEGRIPDVNVYLEDTKILSKKLYGPLQEEGRLQGKDLITKGVTV